MSDHQNARLNRRAILAGTGAVFGFLVAGCERELTPKQAREQKASFQVLSTEERAIVDALGSRLVPGATEAGLSHYLDVQLSATGAEQLLMIKYLGLEYPFTDFYRQGFAAIEASAQSRYDRTLADLTAEELDSLIAAMSTNALDGWQGPPAPFFYFVIRNDAVDVTYATHEGFEKLGIPYMAHIEPPSAWGP